MILEDLLQAMEAYAELHHVPIIRTSERDTFTRYVREEGAHRVLEVGTAIGYSTLLLARASADDVRITTIEQDEERAGQARRFFQQSPYAEQIDLRVGDASTVLTALTESYDLVFLDAAKGQYVDYLRKIMLLLEPRGMILADNVLFRGYVLGNEPVPRRFRTIVKRLQLYIQLVHEIPGFETEICEEGDGLAVTRWNEKGDSCRKNLSF